MSEALQILSKFVDAFHNGVAPDEVEELVREAEDLLEHFQFLPAPEEIEGYGSKV